MKCPCHSGIEYSQCCKPYHLNRNAPTPLALMRSRYSAYALGNADYILSTSHHPQSRQQIEAFCKNTRFIGLDIIESTDNTVTFTAHLTQQNQDATFTEKSLFEKVNGRWLYVKPIEIMGLDRE